MCFLGSDYTVSSSGPAESLSASSFNRFMDSQAVEEALRKGSITCVRYILSSIHSELVAASPDPSPEHLNSVLFLARLCQSISELCPNLKRCILGRQNSSETLAKGMPRQSKKVEKARSTVEASTAQIKWAGLKEELLNCGMEAYNIWSSALSKVRYLHKCRFRCVKL